MTLTNCPNCGQAVTDRTPVCPNCGKSLKEAKLSPDQKKKSGIL